jgi:hypothetical protein
MSTKYDSWSHEQLQDRLEEYGLPKSMTNATARKVLSAWDLMHQVTPSKTKPLVFLWEVAKTILATLILGGVIAMLYPPIGETVSARLNINLPAFIFFLTIGAVMFYPKKPTNWLFGEDKLAFLFFGASGYIVFGPLFTIWLRNLTLGQAIILLVSLVVFVVSGFILIRRRNRK